MRVAPVVASSEIWTVSGASSKHCMAPESVPVLQKCPPRIQKSKLLKIAIDDKVNVIEMDDDAEEDEDESEESPIQPDFSSTLMWFFDDEGSPLVPGHVPATHSLSTCEYTGRDEHVGGEFVGEDAISPSAAAKTHLPWENPGPFDPSLREEGLEAVGPTPKLSQLTGSAAAPRLLSAGLKKPKRLIATGASGCGTKENDAGGVQAASADVQAAKRYGKLLSASNRLGGGYLYQFRDTVGAKRAREAEDSEQSEASYVKAKRIRAVKSTTVLRNELADLESSSSGMDESVMEMMMVLRLENERKAEIRRAEEDQRRREGNAARETRIQAEKLEDEERRRHEKSEMDERARRDKEEARARTQEMMLLIGALLKKD